MALGWRSVANCRTVGLGFGLFALAVAGAFGRHAPLIVLAGVAGGSLMCVAACLGRLAWCERRRSAPPSALLLVRGAPPIERFADPRPRLFCAGWLRPRIYVSTGALLGLANDDLRTALAHQRQHARRRDGLRLAVARAVAQGLPFLPVLRTLVGRYARHIELTAVRASVGTASADPTPYGEKQLGPCRFASACGSADVPQRVPRSAASALWAGALIALSALAVHGTGVADLSALDATAAGASLCLVAIVALLLLAAATALQTEASTG
jgi:hypothetical protein